MAESVGCQEPGESGRLWGWASVGSSAVGGFQQLLGSSILEPSAPSRLPLRCEIAAGTGGGQVPRPEVEEEKEEERGCIPPLPASLWNHG